MKSMKGCKFITETLRISRSSDDSLALLVFIRRLTASVSSWRSPSVVLLVLLAWGLGGQELEALEDGVRDGRRLGQVSALRPVAVLISCVRDGVVLAVIPCVREATLRDFPCFVTDLLQTSLLYSLRAVTSLETVTINHI